MHLPHSLFPRTDFHRKRESASGIHRCRLMPDENFKQPLIKQPINEDIKMGATPRITMRLFSRFVIQQ